MSDNFKEVMKSKNDKELLKVMNNKDDYQQEAIKAAEEEIIRRGGLNKLKDEIKNKQIMDKDKLESKNLPTLSIACSVCDHVQSKNNKKCTKCDSVLSKNNTTRVCPKCCFKKNDYKSDRGGNCLWDLNEEFNTGAKRETSVIKRHKGAIFFVFMIFALVFGIYPLPKTNNSEVENLKKDLTDVKVNIDDHDLFSFNGGTPSSETMGSLLDIVKEFSAKMDALQADYDLKIKSIGQTELADIQDYVDLQKLNEIRVANVSERNYTAKYFDDSIALISSCYDKTDERFGKSSPESVTCPSLISLMKEKKTLTLANIDSYVSLLDYLTKNNAQIYIEQGQLVSENNTVRSKLNSIQQHLEDLSKKNEALESKYTVAMSDCLAKFNKARENLP